ncbi:MAG: AAA family ATPase [Steroidobacteraceae bacterium]
MPQLLERDTLLAALAAAQTRAGAGEGALVFVSGEPGVGKTSLLEAFALRRNGGRVLWGNCEALATPRPLGPLCDLGESASSRLRSALQKLTDRIALFAATLAELSEPPLPVVFVIEDVHWADAATLDLIRHIGRRIARLPALLILSCRDDAVSLDNIRAVLGDLPAAHVLRLSVPRLSRGAVASMAAASGHDAGRLYEASGGNAFFVAELLRQPSRSGTVPASVRDAVLTQAARLGPAALEVLQLASLLPGAAPLSLLRAVLGAQAEAAEACVLGGLLIGDGDLLRFRHDLARSAIEHSIAAPRRLQWHARILAALAARPTGSVSLAQLAHHAQGADDADAILHYAPAAAREAAERGARREAAAHCRAALRHAQRLPDVERARLLDAYAGHGFELNELDTAIPARAEAIALFAAAGDVRGQCAALAAHAMPLVRALRNAEADAASQQAIALAQTLPAGRELALAYATQSYLRMLNRDYQAAIGWGEKAIALAEALGEQDILARAHLSLGAALIFIDYAGGCAAIETSRAIAATLHDGGVGSADAFVMLGSASGEVHEFLAAEQYLADGIAYARTHDLDRLAGYMEAWQALCDLYRGRWHLAGQRANEIAAREAQGSTNRVTALIALGRLRARRGDPGAPGVLDEALQLAQRSGTLQRLAPVCAARAELAWLARADATTCQAEALRAYDLAQSKGHPWFVGELAFWQWRSGRFEQIPPGCAEPFRLQMLGQWREAAQAWNRLGCPYEEARALADGDEAAQCQALAMLDALGARPLADAVRADLKAAGVQSVPRGPRARTRDNPAGLTPRELQILSLLAAGCTTTRIAGHLSRSTRTVDHHIEAIFAKLKVANRGDAVLAGHRLGLLAKMGMPGTENG